jgi:hypothetical protein
MSICTDQQVFNHAFYTALKASRKKDKKKMRENMACYAFIHFLFSVWAVFIALQVPEEKRVIHLTAAILFAPAYVIAFYLSLL